MSEKKKEENLLVITSPTWPRLSDLSRTASSYVMKPWRRREKSLSATVSKSGVVSMVRVTVLRALSHWASYCRDIPIV